MKNRITLVLILIGAIAFAMADYYRSAVSADAPRFNTATATRQDIVQTVEATGTLSAVTTVQVGSQISGSVQALR